MEETLTSCDFPREHWTRIRTNNVIERLNREIRRRARVAGTQWSNKKQINMKPLEAGVYDVAVAG